MEYRMYSGAGDAVPSADTTYHYPVSLIYKHFDEGRAETRKYGSKMYWGYITKSQYAHTVNQDPIHFVLQHYCNIIQPGTFYGATHYDLVFGIAGVHTVRAKLWDKNGNVLAVGETVVDHDGLIEIWYDTPYDLNQDLALYTDQDGGANPNLYLTIYYPDTPWFTRTQSYPPRRIIGGSLNITDGMPYATKYVYSGTWGLVNDSNPPPYGTVYGGSMNYHFGIDHIFAPLDETPTPVPTPPTLDLTSDSQGYPGLSMVRATLTNRARRYISRGVHDGTALLPTRYVLGSGWENPRWGVMQVPSPDSTEVANAVYEDDIRVEQANDETLVLVCRGPINPSYAVREVMVYAQIVNTPYADEVYTEIPFACATFPYWFHAAGQRFAARLVIPT
jgi:hypothetical protein